MKNHSPKNHTARALEDGRLGSSWFARRLGDVWAAHARVERRVSLPRGAVVCGVGGATLGGSYKTPLVIALARALAERGESVAVVGHGYRALGFRAGTARRVDPRDAVRDVGDDALWAARELSSFDVPVYVGPKRSAALALAAAARKILIVDSLLQTAPERLALSVLAVDARAPWGAARCPPVGDLLAPISVLVGATDLICLIGATSDGERSLESSLDGFSARHAPRAFVPSVLDGAVAPDETPVPISALAGMRVGLVLAIARPARVLGTLAAVGVHPVETRTFADHAAPTESHRPGRVHLWLTTPKCKTKLGATYEGAPLYVLKQRLSVPELVLARLRT
jgi:tetraacyldisaccharide 4'-kinase